MNKLVTLAAVAALALVALVSPAAAYHGAVDVDECGDAPTNGADILAFSVDSKGTSGEDGWITAAMALCGVPVKGAKYRVHFDYKNEFASARNEACRTTSDTIVIHTGGAAEAKNGGPAAIKIDKTTLTHSTDTGTVTQERYTIVFKVRYKDLGVFAGDDVEVWADIQSNGIADRVPNTNGDDGCAKPQEEAEVLGIELVD
jgi:hypothetical protein